MILNNGQDWRLDPEKKKKWIEALRSGKYKQGMGFLVFKDSSENNHYCCLGVYAEIIPAVSDGFYFLSKQEIPEEVQTRVSSMNDGYGVEKKNFNEIADWIEINL